MMYLIPEVMQGDQTKDASLKVDDKNHIGFLAQEIEKILPQVVNTANDTKHTKTVAYSDVVPVLVEAIKEQQSTIDAQQKQIDKLKEMIGRSISK